MKQDHRLFGQDCQLYHFSICSPPRFRDRICVWGMLFCFGFALSCFVTSVFAFVSVCRGENSKSLTGTAICAFVTALLAFGRYILFVISVWEKSFFQMGAPYPHLFILSICLFVGVLTLICKKSERELKILLFFFGAAALLRAFANLQGGFTFVGQLRQTPDEFYKYDALVTNAIKIGNNGAGVQLWNMEYLYTGRIGLDWSSIKTTEDGKIVFSFLVRGAGFPGIFLDSLEEIFTGELAKKEFKLGEYSQEQIDADFQNLQTKICVVGMILAFVMAVSLAMSGIFALSSIIKNGAMKWAGIFAGVSAVIAAGRFLLFVISRHRGIFFDSNNSYIWVHVVDFGVCLFVVMAVCCCKPSEKMGDFYGTGRYHITPV